MLPVGNLVQTIYMLRSVQKSKHIRNFLLVLFLLVDALNNVGFLQASEEIVVVTHPGVSAIQNNISKNSLRAIFGMRLRTWADGSTIKVFVLPDDNLLHQHFSKEKLNVFPYQLRLAWDRLVFSGMGQSPIKVDSEKEMLEEVASTPGAIGYLRRNYIDDSINVLQLK